MAKNKQEVPIEEKVEEKKNEVQEASVRQKGRHPGPWVKMSEEQVAKHNANGTLFGYDPSTGEGIIKEGK